MTRHFKTVAIVLALILGAQSMFAIGNCLGKKTEFMAMHCGEHCPMMQAAAATRQMRSVSTGRSCCDISPERPVPLPLMQEPGRNSERAGLSASHVATVDLTALPASKAGNETPLLLPRSSPAQAALCIFLI